MSTVDLTLAMSEYAMSLEDVGRHRRRCNWSIEERNFVMILIMFEAHFSGSPPVGPRTVKKSTEILQETLKKSLERGDIRESYGKNVDIWMRLRCTLYSAIPVLGRRSLRGSYGDTASNTDIPESSFLIAENHASLTMDLTLINTLLLLARNMLAIKRVAQDLCSAVHFDRQIIKLIALCVNVTSKGYDGENVGSGAREKLTEVTELYKKLLVSCLQVVHNLTMHNDYQKMVFCCDMLFDNEMTPEMPTEGLNVDVVYEEVLTWLRHNRSRTAVATELLMNYVAEVELGNNPGPLPEQTMDELIADAEHDQETLTDPDDTPYKGPDPVEKPQVDAHYPNAAENVDTNISGIRKVSREIEDWWTRMRDPNYEGWVVPMETVQDAQKRAQACKDQRYFPNVVDPDQGADYENGDLYIEDSNGTDLGDEPDNGSLDSQDGQDGQDGNAEEGEDEDDDSYVEGPLRGLLTEVPNILDAKQIEALHMTVKACIVDSMGSGMLPTGENLQETRGKMFLALDCGKNLLREMLVFIAVWEERENNFIFQVTAQIVESFHHNALLPCAWNSLRIIKDIVSPAQTVLLRLINYMFRARKENNVYTEVEESERDAKLVHFLFKYFRRRVVPDCIALIHAQAQIRVDRSRPSDFPVDLWDMERAKDGLAQYLEFLLVVTQIPEMRQLLIEWEAVYELITLLNALWAGVDRKSFDERNAIDRAVAQADRELANMHLNSDNSRSTQTPQLQGASMLPPLHDTPHKFPWSGIKTSILEILSFLVGEPGGLSASPLVQAQILNLKGVDSVLQCCCYDGWNELSRQRAELCLKYITMGCGEAQREIAKLAPVENLNVDEAATTTGVRVYV